VVAAVAAQTVVAVTADAEQNCQNDDPPNIVSAEAIAVTHNPYLQNKFLSITLIPCYSSSEKRCVIPRVSFFGKLLANPRESEYNKGKRNHPEWRELPWKKNRKGWLYLLPSMLFLGVFMVYPLIDVFIYSFEEGFHSVSQSYNGVGLYNYAYVLRDPYFLQAVKNTFLLVIITVPLSTGLALLISLGLSSVRKLRNLFQTIFFLPYVTNTLAVGLVFMILFKKTTYTDGLVNLLITMFGGESVDFITGPYWAKMLVLSLYTVWVVMPFKVLVLTGALASVNDTYYNAARVDGTRSLRMFSRITLPMISPSVFYLVVTGFIGAFKAYSDSVALFGSNLNDAGMNTIVGYVYDMLYGASGGYPSFASAAAIVLFAIVLTVTCINLMGSRKFVHYT